jgi:pilus assembly protein CpaC
VLAVALAWLLGALPAWGAPDGSGPAGAGSTPAEGIRQAAVGNANSNENLVAPRRVAPLGPGVAPFGPGQVRLPLLDGALAPLGETPHPTPEQQAEYGRFVRELKDPESTLDLILGRTRLMVLTQGPVRIQIADPKVAGASLMCPTEVTLIGRAVGTTILTLWFQDPQAKCERVLTYLVRVLPDPEMKKRLERVYVGLQDEINKAFPDSLVTLSLVGDKVVVSGQAKDVSEATQILRIIRANVLPMDTASIPVELIRTGIPLHPGEPPPVNPDNRLGRGVEDWMLAGGPHVINLLKIPGEQQIMLRVTVAEVSRAAARSIGLNFSINNHAGNVIVGNTTGNIANGTGFSFSGTNFLSPMFTFTNSIGTGLANIPVALDNGQIRLAIAALRDLDYAKSLAEPNLVTLNGQTATFQAGGRFPVPVVASYNFAGLQGVQFIPFGVQLTFTPYLTDRDRIRLNVAADISSRDLSIGTTLIAGASVPNLITRNFQTTVELREGQTLAVAGLIQNTLGANSQRVPFFGDLPLVGRLAGYDHISAGEQELVVLITPELVHPLEPKEVGPLPGSDLFEPDDCEFYLLGRLESRQPVDYRSPVRTDIERVKHYHQVEKNNVIGPAGHCPAP